MNLVEKLVVLAFKGQAARDAVERAAKGAEIRVRTGWRPGIWGRKGRIHLVYELLDEPDTTD